jgi:hypothetical protein
MTTSAARATTKPTSASHANGSNVPIFQVAAPPTAETTSAVSRTRIARM